MGSIGRLIVTPDMEPPDATHWDAQEQTYRAGATSWNGIHQQIVTDSARFRNAADSQGFDEVHRVNAVLAEEAKTIAEWHVKVADKCADIATVLRDTRAGQEQLVRDADADREREAPPRRSRSPGGRVPRYSPVPGRGGSSRRDGIARLVQEEQRKHKGA